PEMQVLDDLKHPDGKSGQHQSGALYEMIAPNDKKVLKPVGEFNTAKLIIHGTHAEHWLNGKKIVEYEFFSPEWKALFDKSKYHKDTKFAQTANSPIDLQDHGNEVWFKNMKIRKLNADGTAAK